MTALIFGSSGQDGFYLQRLLEQIGYDVIGISRSKPGNFVDITSFEAICNLISTTKPDFIFHLAAISATTHTLVFENFDTIVKGSVNLLEAVKLFSPGSKVFLSGSGLQFKNRGLPINELTELDANSSYSMARIQSLYAARYYRTFGLKIYYGYFFNHDSPLRESKHVSQMIASAVKRIKTGSTEKISIGNYDVKKEWGFAGDIVNGIWTLVNQDKVFEAVIGTGKAYSIKQWLEVCFSLINKNWEDHVELKKSFVPEYDTLVSDPKTILNLGWIPRVTFENLAKIMVLDEKA
jgi:GDPmannose 4,6-dehydratase